jgi:hypothetical protein
MKGKAFTYLMVAVNVLVWSYIIYLVIGYLSPKDEIDFNTNYQLPKTKSVEALDSITVDPFLGQTMNIKPAQSTNKTASGLAQLNFPKKENTIPIPNTTPSNPLKDLKFHGLIKSNSNNKKTGLWSLRDSSFFLREGDVFLKFKLLTLTPDSTVFRGEKKQRVVLRVM